MPVIVAVPDTVAVNVTEHEPDTNVQVVELKLPVAVPVALHVTVPVGVVTVPGEMSATEAVQVEPCAITTGDVQVTVVDVNRTFTVMLELPLLPE